MKVVQINCTYNVGSTGKITKDVHHFLLRNGVDSYVLYSDNKSSDKNTYKYMNKFERNLFSLHSHIIGNYGFEGVLAAKRVIKFLKKEKPDIVQIHNIHSHNGSLKCLFKFLNKTNIQICYSFHDCWPFTGYCPHFVSYSCSLWKKECNHCPAWKEYSFFFDKSRKNFNQKKTYLTNCKNLHLILASNWIKNTAQESFLKNKDMIVFPDGIDQNVFRVRENIHFKKIFPIDKINILGVAYNFTIAKGILDFIKLANLVDENVNIVLVGNIDESLKLPNNITCIPKQDDQNLLSELFSNADIFMNLTKEESFGLTNIEALSCGTPVITYNSGGSPESIDDFCGSVIDEGDFEGLVNAIHKYGKKNSLIKSNCLKRSLLFSQEKMCENYLNFYKDLIKKRGEDKYEK